MNAYLLDTSAILTYLNAEEGHDKIQALFSDPASMVLLTAPVLLELNNALKRKGIAELERHRIVTLYATRLAEVLPVDLKAVLAAIAIRDASPTRLPAMDALIAGCAAAHGAVLVHRDPHFDTVPAHLLKTWNILRDKDYPGPNNKPAAVKEQQTQYRSRKRHKTAVAGVLRLARQAPAL